MAPESHNFLPFQDEGAGSAKDANPHVRGRYDRPQDPHEGRPIARPTRCHTQERGLVPGTTAGGWAPVGN